MIGIVVGLPMIGRPMVSNVGNDNTSLADLEVNGSPVSDGDTVSVDNGTTDVTLTAVPTDPGATITTPTGSIGVSTGNNNIPITVRASDGHTTQTYHVTVHVMDGGLPEITDVTMRADVNGSNHGQYFTMYRDGNEAVAVILNCGAVTFAGTIDFNGVDQNLSDFSTGFGGYTLSVLLTVPDGSGGSTTYAFCIKNGSMSLPWMSNVTNISVNYTGDDTDAPTLAQEFVDACASISNLTVSTTGDGVVHLANSFAGGTGLVGPIEGFTDAHYPDAVIITNNPAGRDDAQPIDGETSIVVGIADNFSATNVAIQVQAATNGQGWSVVRSTTHVVFTDSVVGDRGDAFSSFFTVNITQNGRGPG